MQARISKLQIRDGIVYFAAVPSLYVDDVWPERIIGHTDASYDGLMLTKFNPTIHERHGTVTTESARLHMFRVHERGCVAARFRRCAQSSVTLDESASGAAGRCARGSSPP